MTNVTDGRKKHVFKFKGSVIRFGKVIDTYQAATYAISERKAKANLLARYKEEHNMALNTALDLVGKFEMEG